MSGGGADAGGRTWSRHYRRPYTVTGGRTRPAHDDLELETLVQTVTGIDEQLAGLGREQRSIAALCREVVSVTEISARLDLLLGVTRVIIGDMALQGVGPRRPGAPPSLARRRLAGQAALRTLSALPVGEWTLREAWAIRGAKLRRGPGGDRKGRPP
jgi:hypothetical protein